MADKPNTDDWTDLFGQFKSDVDTHVEMIGGTDVSRNDQYTLRRMIFISLRDFFRNTPEEKFKELKQQA